MPANLSAFGGGARAYTPPSVGQVSSASPMGGANPMQMMALQNILGGSSGGQGQQEQNGLIQPQQSKAAPVTADFSAQNYGDLIKQMLLSGRMGV